MARMEIVAVDPSLTFEERRRERIARRGDRRAREQLSDLIIGGILLVGSIAAGVGVCWGWSLAYAAGIVG